jgi:DNA modification methylase
MPSLIWPGKSLPENQAGTILPDSVVFPRGKGYPEAIPTSRLIYGDNLAIMAALLPEYAGQIDLIYTDPPFFTNRRYRARVGQGEDSRRPQDWELAEGYPDHWEDIEAYLNMLYPRLVLMHRLLSERGTLYLHLDWHANHYARLLLDEIFGRDRLLNEIVWAYHGPSPIRSAFNRKHDTILVYTKSEDYTFNVDEVREPYSPNTVKTFESSPKAGFGKIPDLARGKVPEDWWYFPVVARLHSERTGYPTQKPEALLERIIRASSNPGDLVADFFCGSGTSLAVAERTQRRFVGVDTSWRAIHTSRARLASAAETAFRVEFEAGSRIPITEAQDDPAFEVQQTRSGIYTLHASKPEEILYWEIDPAWESGVFMSANQASRPRKNKPIQFELVVSQWKAGGLAKARLVNVEGVVWETTIK